MEQVGAPLLAMKFTARIQPRGERSSLGPRCVKNKVQGSGKSWKNTTQASMLSLFVIQIFAIP